MAKIETELFGTLALLPVQATVPVHETLEWKTDLMTSFNGSETAQRLRAHPRQTIAYTFPEGFGVTRSQFIAQYGALRNQWAIPLWTEAQFLGAVQSGATELHCETEYYDFRNGSLGLIYQSPESWQILEIVEVDKGKLALSKPARMFRSAWLMPVRVGHIVSKFERDSAGHSAVTKVTFNIDDLRSLPEAAAQNTYKGSDLYTDATLFQNDRISSQLQTRTDIVDYETGVIARKHPWLYNRILKPMHVLCESPREVRLFKEWLMRRCGRFRPYWEPSFENDLAVRSTGFIAATLLIANDGYRDWGTRNNLAIQLRDGTWLAREVAASFTIGVSELQLTLNDPLNIAASEIYRISFMGYKRLDTDRVEMSWIGNGVLQCSINTVELNP